MKESSTVQHNLDPQSQHEAASSSLPDINAETYPFETVQRLLDQAAYFNLYSLPEQKISNIEIRPHSSGEIIGFNIREQLHRFVITMHVPNDSAGVRATNQIGERLGRFTARWLIIPDGFTARPAVEPPLTAFDPHRSQRFVMLNGTCRFGDGKDGFNGFGTGRTYPIIENGQRKLLVAAVGNITSGFGKFAGCEGTYTYCGSFTSERGFVGSLVCRVMDSEGILHDEKSLPNLEADPAREQGVTYLLFRGQKKDRSQKTTYRFGSSGEVTGLNVNQQLRQFHLDASAYGHGGLRSVANLGPVIGAMKAAIIFNLLNPGAPGTSESPIPFQSYNEFGFFDRRGESIGSIIADGGEGRTFNMKLKGAPGQSALRFGGFGPVVEGTDWFAGIQGMMSDNSVVGVAPHAISTLYVLRINDPDGKYRMY